MPFPSFLGGGFECAQHRGWHGRQLDLIAATGHDRHAAADYRALAGAGLLWARDSLRWQRLEPAPGQRSFADWLPMLEAGEAAGIRIAWDILHFGLPDWLDPWSPDFPARARDLAAAAALTHRRETGRPGMFCPINEISFWAFAGGDVGWMTPLATGRGNEWKDQLLTAAIAMARAIRAADPAATLLWAEPLIAILPGHPHEEAAARHQEESQFEAYDRLLGRDRPELGGSPDLADLMGFNHYPHNQRLLNGGLVGFGTAGYRPLSVLMETAARRYPGYRLLLTETGAEGSGRAAWLHYVADELHLAGAAGVPIDGACLYPVTDYPGWDDDRHCPTGLFGLADADGRRPLHAPLAAATRALEARLGTIRNPRPLAA